MKLNPTMMPVMIPAISVDGKEPAESTKIIEEEVLPEIESLEGVASVNSFGDIEETIRITVKEDKVSSVDGLSLIHISQQLRQPQRFCLE